MAEWIVGGRRTGKTTAALERLLADDSTILVVSTHARAASLRPLAEAAGIDPDRIMSARQRADRRNPPSSAPKVIVDEVEDVLSALLGGLAIEAMTGSPSAVTSLNHGSRGVSDAE